jgi:beta-hydroxylase
LLDSIPGLTTAFFSILSPHKRISEHRGPWRGVLRYHLALQVPEPLEQAGISVGGKVKHWREGQSLLFDDSYRHFAWNETDGVRVVLFVDVIRPLKPPADQLNRALIWAIGRSPYISDARKRHEAWERRFEALRARTDS